MPNPLEGQAQHFAEASETFSDFKFGWIAWPERHFIIPVKSVTYNPATKTFDLVLNYRPPATPIPKPFTEKPTAPSHGNLKDGIKNMHIGMNPDLPDHKIIWLIRVDEQLKDGVAPAKRLKFQGHILDPIHYSEPRNTTLIDLNGACEARCQIRVMSAIAKYGDWKKPESIGKLLFGVAKGLVEVGAAVGVAALKGELKGPDESYLKQHQGAFHTFKPYPQMFEEVETLLRTRLAYNIKLGITNIDKSRGELVAGTSFMEYHSESFGSVQRTCTISLTLQAQQTGTLVHYSWEIEQQFPMGSIKCGQVVFEVNRAIKLLCDQAPSIPLPEDEPFEQITEEFEEQDEQHLEQEPIGNAPHPIAVKLANTFAQLLEQDTPDEYSPALPPANVNMSEWAKEIRIDFPVETGYSPCIFTPDSELPLLVRLAYAYEVNDPYARYYMDENDYFRVLSWIKVKRALNA